MSQDSYAVRRKRRLKQNLSSTRRELRLHYEGRMQAHFTLLLAIKAAGGRIEVDAATIREVMAELQTLNWKSGPNPDKPGALVIEVVGAAAAAEPASEPALTVSRVDEGNNDAEDDGA